MESGKYIWVNKIAYILIFLILLSCKREYTDRKDIEEVDFKESISSISFKNGDLVYRHGNGVFSDFFRKTSTKEQLYSHGGIIQVCNDTVYVIHTEASELTGIGCAKKESIFYFLKGIDTWGVYRIDTIQCVLDSIVKIGNKFVIDKTPFDLDFDNTTIDRIYCSQLLAISINEAIGRPIIKADNNFGGKKYYSVDDTYIKTNAKLIYKQIKK